MADCGMSAYGLDDLRNGDKQLADGPVCGTASFALTFLDPLITR